MGGIKLKNALGVVGGVGPVASAEFLKTIYEECIGMCEQQMPKVFLSSDPSFPSRSETSTGNSDEEICIRLQKELHDFSLLSISPVLICCITMHHLLPRLPARQRKNIISLVDVIFDRLARLRRPHVVLCSARTSRVQLFQRHPGWPAVGQFVIMPDEKDQWQVEDFISKLKRNITPDAGKVLLSGLAEKYGTRRFICGCTEMHLLAKWFQRESKLKRRYTFLDPLMIVAQSLARNCA